MKVMLNLHQSAEGDGRWYYIVALGYAEEAFLVHNLKNVAVRTSMEEGGQELVVAPLVVQIEPSPPPLFS